MFVFQAKSIDEAKDELDEEIPEEIEAQETETETNKDLDNDSAKDFESEEKQAEDQETPSALKIDSKENSPDKTKTEKNPESSAELKPEAIEESEELESETKTESKTDDKSPEAETEDKTCDKPELSPVPEENAAKNEDAARPITKDDIDSENPETIKNISEQLAKVDLADSSTAADSTAAADSPAVADSSAAAESQAPAADFEDVNMDEDEGDDGINDDDDGTQDGDAGIQDDKTGIHVISLDLPGKIVNGKKVIEISADFLESSSEAESDANVTRESIDPDELDTAPTRHMTALKDPVDRTVKTIYILASCRTKENISSVFTVHWLIQMRFRFYKRTVISYRAFQHSR